MNKNNYGYVNNGDRFTYYIVNVSGLESNQFYRKLFGNQLNDLKTIERFKLSSKTAYINCKHAKSNLNAVKRWIKDNNPSQYYCNFDQGAWYKDDCVSLYYID